MDKNLLSIGLTGSRCSGTALKPINHEPYPQEIKRREGTFDSSLSDTQPKTDVLKPLFASYSIMKPLQGKSRCIREQR